MRPTERTGAGRPAAVVRGSSRRGRRRTLFSATAPRRRESIDKTESSDPSHPVQPPEPIGAAEPVEPQEPIEGESAEPAGDMAESELEEYVVDRDDYPQVTADRRHARESTMAQPDRVADIDDWLEEFAVEDCSEPSAG